MKVYSNNSSCRNGQIGKFFPDTDAAFKDMDSKVLLSLLKTDLSNVNIKATTTEKLGFIASEAVVLIEKWRNNNG